ncbi:hypothetical protein [Nocardioides litoris]|uniref:hypothetical protein n=1 Tax=Nocardioides litoris TaxID=1926648 RepID=UPI001121D959|nr:hypothetical protein [Nocardioides litoris]
MSLGSRHFAALAGALLLPLTASACGSSLDPADPASPGASSAAPSAAAAAGGQRSGKARGKEDRSAAGEPRRARNADGSPLELTGKQLCADLPADAAGRALGVAVESAEPGETATPQCTYGYENAAGDDSTATLAAMRPADIGGRTGLEAFAYMVDLSRGLAGPVDLQQEDLRAGDKAVRITGGGVHTGVLAAGGFLLTVTVPERDADAGEVDALVTEVARVLA